MPTLNRKSIIKKIKEYVKEKGEIPTVKKFVKYAQTSTTIVYRNFNSFNSAISKAGYKPINAKSAHKNPEEDIIYNIPEFCRFCLLKKTCVYDYEVEECPFYQEGWANEKGGWS